MVDYYEINALIIFHNQTQLSIDDRMKMIIDNWTNSTIQIPPMCGTPKCYIPCGKLVQNTKSYIIWKTVNTEDYHIENEWPFISSKHFRLYNRFLIITDSEASNHFYLQQHSLLKSTNFSLEKLRKNDLFLTRNIYNQMKK